MSQVALEFGLSLVPAANKVNEQVQVFLPIFTFSFLKTSELTAARDAGLSLPPITKDIKKSGTHWHPAGPSANLVCSERDSPMFLGQTSSISCGQEPSIIGHTLVKPDAQDIAMLCMGQLQSQSHCPLPSGQSHLQEHCIPSPV